MGFDESIAGIAAQTAVRIDAEVCATPTGPCYEAADRPAHVAFLTGLSVFDRHASNIEVAGDAVLGIMRGLGELTRIPPGAVA